MQKGEEFRRLPVITLALIGLTMLLVTTNINWGKDHWNQIVRSDGEGYYAYLPAIFIYHDLNFGFFDRIKTGKYYDPDNYADYRQAVNNKLIDKYFCGEAMVIAPFWLAAHVWANIAGFERDGFSKPYPLSVTIAAVFYLLVGLFFLSKVLIHYKLSPLHRSLVMAAVLFGTNLFYYSFGEPSVSHVYSFAFISMFFYYMIRYFSLPSGRLLLACGVLLGIIILIRPVNVLVILSIPFAAGSWRTFIDGIRKALKRPEWLCLAIISMLMICAIQAVIYKISTGSFFVYSYGTEAFDFRQQHFFDFLFSYKKGYFLYTPLAFIGLAGFWYIWKSNHFSFYSLAAYMIFVIYILSSWWNWWYGGSFSSRVMVDYLVFLTIPLGMAVSGIKKRWLKALYFVLIVSLVVLCQIQTYQYRYYRIHWDQMNKERYWNVFLRIDQI